jgi:hypothetical protein
MRMSSMSTTPPQPMATGPGALGPIASPSSAVAALSWNVLARLQEQYREIAEAQKAAGTEASTTKVASLKAVVDALARQLEQERREADEQFDVLATMLKQQKALLATVGRRDPSMVLPIQEASQVAGGTIGTTTGRVVSAGFQQEADRAAIFAKQADMLANQMQQMQADMQENITRAQEQFQAATQLVSEQMKRISDARNALLRQMG